MKLDKMDYQTLIDMGFTRHEIQDNVLFRQTGYSGFSLEMEFPLIDIGISSGCFVSNEKQQWQFKLYKVSTGDTMRSVELIELKNLIELFQIKSEQMKEITAEINKI